MGEGEEKEGKAGGHERRREEHISTLRKSGVRQAKRAVIMPTARMLAEGNGETDRAGARATDTHGSQCL